MIFLHSSMRCELLLHRQFKKDLQKLKRAGWNMEQAKAALFVLAEGPPFPVKYGVHELQGSMQGVYDMHVTHNWLILFCYREKNVIEILRTGTHASINLTE